MYFYVISRWTRCYDELKRLNFTHIGVDGMKCGADVNASAGSTVAREMNYAIGIHGICPVRRALVAVTSLYVRVISRPYRGRFTTTLGPRSVLGTSRSHHRKARKSTWFYYDHRSHIQKKLFFRQFHYEVRHVDPSMFPRSSLAPLPVV